MTGSATPKDGLGITTNGSLWISHFTVSGSWDLLVVLCMRLLWFASLDSNVL